MSMRRYLPRGLLLILLAVALILGGCWDYRDLETRSFVLGMGVDIDGDAPDGGYVVTAEIVRPTGGRGTNDGDAAGPGSGKLVVSARGRTPADAVLQLNNRLERFPLWRQLLAIIVSEEVARDDLRSILDFVLRDPQRNSLARLYITSGSAREILEFQPAIQPLVAALLKDLEKQRSNTARFPKPRYVRDVERRLDDGPVLVPRIELAGDTLQAQGSAVLSDHKLVGWLDEDATDGASWLLGDVSRTGLAVPCPVAADGTVTLVVFSTGRRLHVGQRKNIPHFHYELSARARLLELNRCPLNPAVFRDRRLIEEAAGRALERRIERTIRLAQHELRTDVFRAGVDLRRHDLPLWRSLGNWTDVFPTVPVSVAAKVEIRTAGSIDAL